MPQLLKDLDRLTGLGVLLVGSRTHLSSLEPVLKGAGARVLCAPDGESALATLASQVVDLVLTEVSLLGMSGYELCRLIRADALRCALPVILLTNVQNTDIVAASRDCDADSFLMRPIEGEFLLKRVGAVLRLRAEPAPAPSAPRLHLVVEELLRANRQLQTSSEQLFTTHRTLKRYAERLETEAELTDGKYRALMQSARVGIFVTDSRGVLLEVNECGEKMLGAPRGKLLGRALFEGFDLAGQILDMSFQALALSAAGIREVVLWQGTEREQWLELTASQMTAGDDHLILVVARDITDLRHTLDELLAKERALRAAIGEREKIQVELMHAQKLEAVGQLAAGIAHEINTPTQYIGDNIHFLRTANVRIEPVLQAYEQFVEAARTGEPQAAHFEAIAQAIKNARLPFLRSEVPKAIDQALEGVERVSTIVQAMKEFSHPGSIEKTGVDINRAIKSTATVARNEWKYVAELELKLEAGLPVVPCLPNEFNQAILNIVINAAHAIAEKLGDSQEEKGKITLETRSAGDHVEIRISDTGTGIPDSIKDKIFNPFFTTKKVGKGTGQGLSIARSVIVDKHRGRFFFESEAGRGTTFFIQLPLVNAEEAVRRSGE